MLNFTFTSRETGKAVTLASVDEHLCEHFGVEVHPEHWFGGWYHLIGFAAAFEGDILNGVFRSQSYSLSDFHEGCRTFGGLFAVRSFELAGMIGRFLDKHYTLSSWCQCQKQTDTVGVVSGADL